MGCGGSKEMVQQSPGRPSPQTVELRTLNNSVRSRDTGVGSPHKRPWPVHDGPRSKKPSKAKGSVATSKSTKENGGKAKESEGPVHAKIKEEDADAAVVLTPETGAEHFGDALGIDEDAIETVYRTIQKSRLRRQTGILETIPAEDSSGDSDAESRQRGRSSHGHVTTAVRDSSRSEIASRAGPRGKKPRRVLGLQ